MKWFDRIPVPIKMTAFVNSFSLMQMPLLAFITPRVIECSAKRIEIRVRLGRRTKNHLNVMYFGALSMGAELSIALKAIEASNASGKRIDVIFKEFRADFLKRSDDHVHFVCDEAEKIQSLIDTATRSEERQEATLNGYAFVPSKSTEPVMTYTLTLSVKQRTKRKPS